MPVSHLLEPAHQVPVDGDFDLCVLGGSCTGVFAAIRAARLGLSVAIVERMGSFGGVATLSMVNVWHSPFDERFEQQIFSGLTVELIERLKQRKAVEESQRNPSRAWTFNASEMQIELDELIVENKIFPYLHTAFVRPHLADNQLDAVIVENKSGCRAIRARFFIDATGDGDLCERLGLATYWSERSQPSTTCAIFEGWNNLRGTDWGKLLREHGEEFGLPSGYAWGNYLPGSELYMLAGTRVHRNCADAYDFTLAEIEGRRQVRAIHDLLRRYAPDSPVTLAALPARIGIRETRHVKCRHRLTGELILNGATYPDAIAHGSYRVDIHHREKPGITLRYLDGRQEYHRPGFPSELSRWRDDSRSSPSWYSIPYRSLIPESPYENLLVAGRFIDADEEAHAAIRVMVNMNQTGEAAGVAAFLALKHGISAVLVDPQELRTLLQDGGSLFP